MAPQCWLKNEHGVAAQGFVLDELARRFAADFLVGGPEKNNAFLERNCRSLEGLKRKESLDDACFHVERARAEEFTRTLVDRHFRECPDGINRIVVAENEKLGFAASRCGWPQDAEMIAAMFLGHNANKRLAIKPKIREELATTVGRRFFGAWGFVIGEEVECLKHLVEARTNDLLKSSGQPGWKWHVENMVAPEGQKNNAEAQRSAVPVKS